MGFGAGVGRGGFGRGYGSGGFGPLGPEPFAAAAATDDTTALRAEAASLRSELEAIQKRLQELESNQP